MSDLSLIDLLDRCLESRHEDAWGELVRRLHPLIAGVVIKTCFRCGVTHRDALDDFIQEVFLKLCRDDARVLRSCELKDETSLFSYLKVVTANVVLDSHKYRSAVRRSHKAERPLDDDFPASRPASDIPLLEVDIERVLHKEDVAIRDRSIFWLYFRQGLSAREIAHMIGMSGDSLSVKGVESCLRRLTTLLRERLTERVSAKGEHF